LPSEAVRGAQWFFHAESEEALIPAAAEYLGTGKLFWASDWPHWDNEYPESLDEILDRDDLADAQKLLRGRDTALRMYGMG
jgi:predicted TIM-barrel fold metal-dependent hydrolase